MNARELADRAGVTERTIRNMIKRGDLQAHKNGNEYEINIEQANELIMKNMYKNEMSSVLGEMGATLFRLESEKLELFESIFNDIKGISKCEDKCEGLSIFESSGNLKKIEKFIELSKEVDSLKKTIKFMSSKVKSTTDKDIVNLILNQEIF